MITLNPHYDKLKANYLFAEISKKVAAFCERNPDRAVIKLGIGDVTRPLVPAVIEAFREGIDEMGDARTFKGYGPEQGYAFLREAIAAGDFASRGTNVDPGDIFVSDGAKCDTANFQEIFGSDITVAVPDPVYPVYVDTNVMAGRTDKASDKRYGGLVYLDSTESNGFVPEVPEIPVDLIYLCFPNNPTGATASRERLAEWVRYAEDHGSLILFDAAYAAFIREDDVPHSIYEIPGADRVAVEFRSFSKTAGFTGVRCAYTVVPEACRIFDADGTERPLKELWNRRQATKFNGVSYPVQKAAAATYTTLGAEQIREQADYYLDNASLIAETLRGTGLTFSGGTNSPYLWVKTGSDSWEFFDRVLEEAAVVITPGSGFGSCGEGYVRISSFNDRENVKAALERLGSILA